MVNNLTPTPSQRARALWRVTAPLRRRARQASVVLTVWLGPLGVLLAVWGVTGPAFASKPATLGFLWLSFGWLPGVVVLTIIEEGMDAYRRTLTDVVTEDVRWSRERAVSQSGELSLLRRRNGSGVSQQLVQPHATATGDACSQ